MEITKGTKSSVEGELPAIIVFSARKHVEYINNIINCVRETLMKNGFKVYLLSDETSSDEHFGKKFEELAEECVLGVVILDGLRPNVVYEYGFLRGRNKEIILLQDKRACVAIKSYYLLPERPSESVISEITGLTKKRFKDLKEPSLGHFLHLSDRQGMKAIVVDCAARSDSPEYPTNVIEKELEKLKPNVIKKYSEQSVKHLEKKIKPEYFEAFQKIALEISAYYAGVSDYEVRDIERIITKTEKLEQSSGICMPPRLFGMIGSLFESLAEKPSVKDVNEAINYQNTAISIYEKVLKSQAEPVIIGNTHLKIGRIYYNISQYQDTRENGSRAIEAYREALKTYTPDEYPMNYAMVQNNIGLVLVVLAEVEDTKENTKKAIEAYREALKTYTPDEYPMNYAMVQNNIGNAFEVLAEVEDTKENTKKAIEAFEEALKTYTKETTPEKYFSLTEKLKSLKKLL